MESKAQKGTRKAPEKAAGRKVRKAWIAAGGADAPPALWYAKTRPQALPAGGIPILYPDLLAEERDDAVKEITDGGDHVLDLAGESGDLLLGAGKLLERVLHGLHL